MLNTHLVIRADNGTLQQAPNALNSASVNVAHTPFFGSVIDPAMLCVGVLNTPISWYFVRVDRFRVWRGVLVNELVKHGLSSMWNDLQPNLALALHGSNGDSFVALVASSHATHLPADIGFIHFNNASQKLTVNLAHRGANTVAE